MRFCFFTIFSKIWKFTYWLSFWISLCHYPLKDSVRRASRRYQLKYVYSALGLLAVHSIYISTLGFLLAMLVWKWFKAWLMCGTCVACAVPCNRHGHFFLKKYWILTFSAETTSHEYRLSITHEFTWFLIPLYTMKRHAFYFMSVTIRLITITVS